MALGPTVKPIPDVYIGPAAAVGAQAEEGTFTFRYSNALTLWDHVTVGVEAGDGSTSDTLYWAWAAKAAELSGGTGDFLESASVNYTIIQENAVEAKLLNQPPAVGAEGWVEGINAALVDGGGLEEISLAAAGMLTFRNIALSPLPEDASYPDPGAGVAGVLDVQEATVFVSDKSTTPGTASFLLVTTDATFVSDDGTGIDFLSGAPVFNFDLVEDYTADSSAFTAFTMTAPIADTKQASQTPSAATVVTNPGAGTITINSPMTNDANRFYYAQVGKKINVDPENLYRASVVVGSSNASAAANPVVGFGFNDRGKSGLVYTETQKWVALQPVGPTSTAPLPMSAYKVPLMASESEIVIRFMDDLNTIGGTLTFSALKVESAPLVDALAAASTVQTISTFSSADWEMLAGIPLGYGGYTAPTGALSTGAQLSVTAATNTHAVPPALSNRSGFIGVLGPKVSTPGKLAIVAITMATSSPDANKLPAPRFVAVEAEGFQTNYIVERDTAATSGPSATPRVYYMVYEPVEAEADFNIYVLAEASDVNGAILISKVEVMEIDLP